MLIYQRVEFVYRNSYNVRPQFDSVQLVNISPISMVYGTQITIVNGIYKPTYNWGVPLCTSVAL